MASSSVTELQPEPPGTQSKQPSKKEKTLPSPPRAQQWLQVVGDPNFRKAATSPWGSRDTGESLPALYPRQSLPHNDCAINGAGLMFSEAECLYVFDTHPGRRG